MKRALHISANQYPDLAKHHFTKKIWLELAKGFDEYHVLARSESNKFEHFQEGNLHLHLVPSLGKRARSFMISSFYMLKIIKKNQITHLLAQSALLGGITAAIASKLFKIPLMCEIHGDIYFKIMDGKSLAYRLISGIVKAVYRQAQVVRSLSPSMTDKLHRFGIDNCIEIPNRVDFNLFNSPKIDYSINDVLKIVSVGRFVWEKNYLQLISDLNTSGMNYQLTLVGGGPLEKDYRSLINDIGINNRVRLINWIKQDDLVSIIRESDLYVQYSISEGMPRTILEAMALAMPIIATDVGFIKGILDQSNSIMIDANNPIAFKNAVYSLTEDIDYRQTIALKAYQDAQSKYSWPLVFEKYRNTFAGMVML